MERLYNISIKIYGALLKLASLFNSKAKLWVSGRKNWKEKIITKIGNEDSVIWFHCSSLGEFEQGRPVIEAIREQYPNYKIAVSFFSPSGYEIRKNYGNADLIFYLPLDTKSNAEKLIKILHPTILVLVKYEYWFNLISALQRNKIPTIVISSIFRNNQLFFKNKNNNWFAKKLNLIQHFFVQNQKSKELLESISISQSTIAGDTRFDRVRQITHQNNKLDFMNNFKHKSKLIVVGSSWSKDEKLFIDLVNNRKDNNWKFLFAPHNMNENEINFLLSKIKQKAIRYSNLNKCSLEELKSSNVLILDTIGILTKVYSYADISYIGGGFGSGIHNTLEAAVFKNPVVFGPKYEKFQEAVDLIEIKGAFSVSNQDEFNLIFNKLMVNDAFRKEAGIRAGKLISNSPNSTEIILNYLTNII